MCQAIWPHSGGACSKQGCSWPGGACRLCRHHFHKRQDRGALALGPADISHCTGIRVSAGRLASRSGPMLTVDATALPAVSSPCSDVSWTATTTQRHRRGLTARGCWKWRGFPPSDDPRAVAGFRKVGDAREQSAQLDGGSQFAALIQQAADRFGSGFIDCEHHVEHGYAGDDAQPAPAAEGSHD
jgi:hypothetical protein